MDAEGGLEVENEEHFWHGATIQYSGIAGMRLTLIHAELFKIVNATCETHEDIDDVLRNYLAFTSHFKRTTALHAAHGHRKSAADDVVKRTICRPNTRSRAPAINCSSRRCTRATRTMSGGRCCSACCR